MRRFEGKFVLVTGATGGLGRSICTRIAAEGGSLMVTDIEAGPCEKLVAGLDRPDDHVAAALDVSDEDAWTALAARLDSSDTGLHGLVNNAGVGSHATVTGETRQKWDSVVAVDQTGVWMGMKHCGPVIERGGGGAIVNVCSILGTVGGLGNSAAYAAAKGAIRTLTKNAALHWATSGVRVNSLHPGYIATDELLERFEGSERHRAMLAGTPMGRLGTASEIAAVVAFLTSDDAAYLTGSEVYADGGWTAQ